MDTRKINSEIKMKQWMEIIRECRSSGQNVKSWCAEHKVIETSYYYWLRKIRTEACKSIPENFESSNQIVPLKIEELKQEPEAIVSSQTAAIIIRLNSAVVEIHNGATQRNRKYASGFKEFMLGDISKAEQLSMRQ